MSKGHYVENVYENPLKKFEICSPCEAICLKLCILIEWTTLSTKMTVRTKSEQTVLSYDVTKVRNSRVQTRGPEKNSCALISSPIRFISCMCIVLGQIYTLIPPDLGYHPPLLNGIQPNLGKIRQFSYVWKTSFSYGIFTGRLFLTIIIR